MFRYEQITLALFFSTPLLLTGCGSDSSSSGGSVATSAPANAVIIDASNAESTVSSAISTTELSELAWKTTGAPEVNLRNSLDLIKQIRSSKGITNSNLITGVTETYACDDGGSLTWTGTETATSDSGTISFSNCNELGYIINGSLSYSSTWNNTTGSYNDTASGSFSMASSTYSFSFSGLNYAENGNEFNYTYTVTAATFSIDFVYNGAGSGGFLARLTAPIVESSGGYYSCPESGAILVTGGNGTTAEGIYNGDGTMTIKANGVIVDSSAYCYY